MSNVDLHALRAEIQDMQARIEHETFYDLLGVTEESQRAEILASFRNLAKKWHVDRYPAEEIGDLRPQIQEIFAHLNTAQATLTNEDKRAEYDMEISDGPDIQAVLSAENHFRRGKSLLQQGKLKPAAESFAKAAELHSDEAEYLAYHLYGEFMLMEKDADGKVRNRKRCSVIFRDLDNMADQLGEKSWHMVFLGAVALGLGKSSEAHGLFREALLIDSKNVEARRFLRLIALRKDKKETFLTKLTSYFSKK